MNNNTLFFSNVKAGFVLTAVLLGALTGCVGHVDGPRASVAVEPTVFVGQDDYTYYPSYGVYYSSSRRQYAYQESGAWVSQPQPRGVSVDVLRGSPSVRMDFHDSPANHHAVVAQKYPTSWKPAKSNEKSGERDEHGGR